MEYKIKLGPVTALGAAYQGGRNSKKQINWHSLSIHIPVHHPVHVEVFYVRLSCLYLYAPPVLSSL